MSQQRFAQVLLVRVCLGERDAKYLESVQLGLEPPNSFHEGNNHGGKAQVSEESELC
jgi:hypothetical protein